MRTALSVAALAAGALAVPYKRDVIYTDYDIVYVTDVVTVTAGQAPAAYTSASSSSEASIAQHYGHHNHPQQSVWTSAWATTWTEAVSAPTSTSTPAPAYTPSTTSTAAPAYTPPPSSTPEPEPETSSAPATTSTPVYQIPLTSYVPIPSSSSAVPKSSAAPYSGGGGDVDPTYQKNVLDSHNLHRSNHSASDIDWDHDLWLIAQSTAQTCRYEHNTTAGGGGYGQNIAAGVDGASIVNVITDMFYNGEEWQFADAGNYGKANPDMSKFEAWGHFTQVVWKDSTHVACYTSDADDCPNGLSSLNPDTNEYEPLAGDIPPFFTVCNYKNPGNYGGEYADNVGKPLGQPISYAPSS